MFLKIQQDGESKKLLESSSVPNLKGLLSEQKQMNTSQPSLLSNNNFKPTVSTATKKAPPRIGSLPPVNLTYEEKPNNPISPFNQSFDNLNTSSSSSSSLSTTQTQPSQSSPQTQQMPSPINALALYNFTGDTQKNQIDLIQNFQVVILSKYSGGWAYGTCNGKSGYFPCTYVREL